VPALWPRFGRGRDGRTFRWALYVKNQEYRAALGFALGALFLLWKVVR
jgi:hypothetical protein